MREKGRRADGRKACGFRRRVKRSCETKHRENEGNCLYGLVGDKGSEGEEERGGNIVGVCRLKVGEEAFARVRTLHPVPGDISSRPGTCPERTEERRPIERKRTYKGVSPSAAAPGKRDQVDA